MNRGQRRAQFRDRLRGGRTPAPIDVPTAGLRHTVAPRPLPQPSPVVPRSAAPTRVRVNELEFRGLERPSALRVAAAFERELAHLFASQPAGPGLRASRELARLAPLRVSSLNDTRLLGEQLARALFSWDPSARRGARS